MPKVKVNNGIYKGTVLVPRGYDLVERGTLFKEGDRFIGGVGGSYHDEVSILGSEKVSSWGVGCLIVGTEANYLLAIRKKPTFSKASKKGMKESTGSQLFSVPNTPEGRAFIAQARSFLGPKRRLVCRGRSRDRKKKLADAGKSTLNARASIPLNLSDWIAVYVVPKT